ncbi:uncharacterized protein LOC131257946 isoform X3 [Magnolia sinica]|uniref:uncharacterized protein LOC131257946 isoform X3 n=1 Tax=Magnolia sinica TaxID=86752 RepID=UPI00265AA9A2|nr:uncharacterized protein LOC131257946 isoform X3 [Magnolia sinica]
MPGPGPHMIYALGSGLGLMHASRARFSPHHCLFYAANAFLGPDLGSFAEWLSSTLSIGGGSILMHVIHDPFYYILVLGLPFSLFYSWLSKLLLHKGFLDTLSGVPLTRRQCLLLVSAGSLSHFFLDHLFEENGHSSMYTWILSTGWWKSRAPIDPDAVVVVGFLCSCLIGGFIYINSSHCIVLQTEACKKAHHGANKLVHVTGSGHNKLILPVVRQSDILEKSSSCSNR